MAPDISCKRIRSVIDLPLSLRLPSQGMDTRTSSYSGSLLEANAAGSVLSFEHLSYAVDAKQGKKLLLDDVSVDIRAGELLAVMVSGDLIVNFAV